MNRQFPWKPLLVGGSALTLAVVLTSCSAINNALGRPNRDSNGEITAAASVAATSVKVGDCLMWAEMSDSFTDVPVRPCTGPHDAQVIGEFESTSASSPIGTELENEAAAKCVPLIESFVGASWQSLGVDPSYTSPDSVSWAHGDRTVQCVLVTSDEQPTLTESLKGKG